MEIIEQYRHIVETIWELRIASLDDNHDSNNNGSLNSVQECATVVSQLIEPTLNLLINAGMLYYTRKSFILCMEEEKRCKENIESIYNGIQEILENYSIDPKIITDIMADIAKKIITHKI